MGTIIKENLYNKVEQAMQTFSRKHFGGLISNKGNVSKNKLKIRVVNDKKNTGVDGFTVNVTLKRLRGGDNGLVETVTRLLKDGWNV
jgi:hypothetical protein